MCPDPAYPKLSTLALSGRDSRDGIPTQGWSGRRSSSVEIKISQVRLVNQAISNYVYACYSLLTENGYGKFPSDPIKAGFSRIFAKFYDLEWFPSYDEYQAGVKSMNF